MMERPEPITATIETAPMRRRAGPWHREEEQRQGTISSARFNIWSTMVGGGSLSLPLAFAKTGNLFLGPLLLISTALLTQFCFGVLLDAARLVSPLSSDSRMTPTASHSHHRTNRATTDTETLPSTASAEDIPEPAEGESTHVGKDSLESITAAAFGERAHWASAVLVTLMCWFGIIGYCVLLRDMLVPVTQWIHHPSPARNDNTGSTVTLANNITMMVVVLLVTPLCTLRTLTALQRFGTASMLSVVILGMCILYRSIECTLGVIHHHHPNTTIANGGVIDLADAENASVLNGSFHFMDGFTFLPKSWKDVLDVLPLFISCYVCHYNLPVVHNDLTDPTPTRVRHWISSTVWGATLFYLVMGVAGSAFAMACGGGSDGAVVVHGNILLNFDAHDPLLLVGRLCLAVTIALAFPVLTIPARDIFLRAMDAVGVPDEMQPVVPPATLEEELREPLLPASGDEPPAMVPVLSMNHEEADEVTHEDLGFREERQQVAQSTLLSRLWISILILWSGALVASCVSSIDIVWDLLGSSLSILLSYLVPCGSYIALRRRNPPDTPPQYTDHGFIVRPPQLPSIPTFCWVIVLFFVPLLFLSTANAIYNLTARS
jgi:amino acid permease